MNQELLLSAFLAHFLGDFVFQTNKIAALKSQSVKGVAYHCLWVFIAYCILFLPYGLSAMLRIACMITISHFFIDYIKLKLGKIKYPLCYFFIDQIAHLLCICLVTRHLNFTNNSMVLTLSRYYKPIILFIICTYIATILIKQFYFNTKKFSFSTHPFFIPTERPIDTTLNTCLLVVLAFGSLIGYCLLPFLCIGYYFIHQHFVPYKKSLLLGKLGFYLFYTVSIYYIYYFCFK